MDRKSLREFTHNVKNFLTVENALYKQWVFRFTFLELEKDLGSKGDITTHCLFKDKKIVSGKVIAKQDGVIAGIEEIKYFLSEADPSFRSRINDNFKIDFKVSDGELIHQNDVVLEITGELHDLLAVERITLNLLGRMSGVATFTHNLIDKIKDYDVLIAPTRKTLWGLLDKKAVTVAGGGTHRLHLTDGMIVKDNHLALLDYNFEDLYNRIVDNLPETRFVEIELEKIDDVLKAAQFFTNDNLDTVVIFMMDNMEPDKIKECISKLKEKNLYDQFLFESSGGIDESNIVEYAKTGVDIISMGCLTDGVKRFDLSMDI